MFKRFSQRQHAFTIIEVMVAVGVIGILSSLAVINFTQSRQNARDGIRKADAPALLAAVNQFVLANGTSFLRAPDAGGRAGSCTLTVGDDPAVPAQGDECIGASGRAYGLVNVGGSLELAGVGGSSTQRLYREKSMIEALKDGGYLNTEPRDPKNSIGKITTQGQLDANPDYALIRACPNGVQHVGGRGQLFAVWVMLERNPSAADKEAQLRVPGNPTAGPLEPGGTNTRYQYDFAAGTTYQEHFEERGYGVSNGPSRPNDVAGVTCDSAA